MDVNRVGRRCGGRSSRSKGIEDRDVTVHQLIHLCYRTSIDLSCSIHFDTLII
jgi:hypothetical protein